MKTLGSIGFSTAILFASMTSVYASHDAKTQFRNDRVSVSKGIHQYDINPFSDSKRVVRNDRVSYAKVKPQLNTQNEPTKKKTYLRNDRVSISK